MRSLFHFVRFLLRCRTTQLVTVSFIIANSSLAFNNQDVPIVVAVGGFASCSGTSSPLAAGIYEPFSRFVDTMNHKLAMEGSTIRAEWIIACHTQSNYGMRVTSSRNPEVVLDGNADTLLAEVEALARLHPENHEVYMVAHSYGGWAAMLTSIKLASWVRLGYIATIDPISSKNCSPLLFIAAYLRSAIGVNPSVGCTQPPTDLMPLSSRISDRVKDWRNYYQEHYFYLHSGPIANAKVNSRREYDTLPLFEFHAHQVMDRDESIWSELAQFWL